MLCESKVEGKVSCIFASTQSFKLVCSDERHTDVSRIGEISQELLVARAQRGTCKAFGQTNPLGTAVPVILLLPDGNPSLDFVDDVTTGTEGLIPMSGDDADPDCNITDGKSAHTVDAARIDNLPQRLANYGRSLRQGKRGVGLVFQGYHCSAAIRVPHPAFEGNESARMTGAK